MTGHQNVVGSQRSDGVRRHGAVTQSHNQGAFSVCRKQLLQLGTNGPDRPLKKITAPRATPAKYEKGGNLFSKLPPQNESYIRYMTVKRRL